MKSQIPFSQILESFTDPVAFVDAGHIIRYMNPAARIHYAKWGDVIGKSIFACHNENSGKIIRDIFTQLQNAKKEVIIHDSEKHRVYMRGVYDGDEKLIGYYERYEAPVK
jgi:DUF438 domain-containing protein